jgi:NAD(P)-dependent dehydrogenase (short-subunit alcohol dehydrogenase family)/pimeloyl-ACP methyl ester carboxylesterase
MASSDSPQRPPSRIVHNGDIALAVYESGDPTAQTVICVHGWPDTHHVWDEVVPLLAQRFHVVSYDTRGHGQSSDPGSVRGFRMSEFAADFRAVADAVSPDRPVHALGHDWGSSQLWEVVCEPAAEDRIASFTSLSGPAVDHAAHWVRSRLARPTPGRLAGPLSQAAASSYMAFFRIPGVSDAFFRAAANPQRWTRFLRAFDRVPAERVHLGETFRRDVVSGLRIYRANPVPLTDPRDRYTAVPIQLIVNERDRAIRPALLADTARWASQLWRRDLPAGHWSPFSHPRPIATAVIELADHLDGATAARGLRRAQITPGRPPMADRLVVITGFGSGIGRETALAFARHGADVVGCDVDLGAAKETAAMVQALGRSSAAYQVDVADEGQMAEFAREVIAEHGVPDVLVNNAGIGHAGAFLATSAADFRHVLDVNLYGVVHGCRAFAPAMAERGTGGHIVNVSSLSAFAPHRAMSAYSTSKAGVFAFSDCLRAELHDTGVGVSTICPGVVHTNIVATTRFSGVSAEEEAAQQQRFDRLYRRRNYTPDKVAAHIVRAVRDNRAVVPVTPEAVQGYYLARLLPAASRRLARVDLFGPRGRASARPDRQG